MKNLTEQQQTKLEQVKREIFDYLTHPHNNQIRGFYDFNGYWANKDKAMQGLTSDKVQILPQIHDYMKSITIEQIVEAAHEEGRNWLHKYGKSIGRPSDSQKYAMKQVYCSINTDFIKTNFEILQRVSLHVGFCIGRFPAETLQKIEDVANHELNSTFYTHTKSRLSNAIFRLEILKSYLIGGKYESAINNKLKQVANDFKTYLESEVGAIQLDEFRKELAPLNDAQSKAAAQLIRNKQTEKQIKEKQEEIRKAKRAVNEKYNVSEYSQILNYI